ncbi:uncharacterized protein LOC123634285 [Lemur catta]|uniref:uncharacterized protein LOC123634285 n=1 Tax=Lemur catta TaxID=9447 RepID=UPI001E267D59|nr:uncharacterized protein LOC123634285 [Lemur catta]
MGPAGPSWPQSLKDQCDSELPANAPQAREGISERADLWVLEQSRDFSHTYQPWQFFACENRELWSLGDVPSGAALRVVVTQDPGGSQLTSCQLRCLGQESWVLALIHRLPLATCHPDGSGWRDGDSPVSRPGHMSPKTPWPESGGGAVLSQAVGDCPKEGHEDSPPRGAGDTCYLDVSQGEGCRGVGGEPVQLCTSSVAGGAGAPPSAGFSDLFPKSCWLVEPWLGDPSRAQHSHLKMRWPGSGSASKRDCLERFGPRSRGMPTPSAPLSTHTSCPWRTVRWAEGQRGGGFCWSAPDGHTWPHRPRLLRIVVSLVNGRPGAMNFSYSPLLRSFTEATNTLLGHLMGKALQDPTVMHRVSPPCLAWGAAPGRRGRSRPWGAAWA